MSSSSRDSHGRGESKSSKYGVLFSFIVIGLLLHYSLTERTSEDSKHGDDESKLSEKFADMSSNGTLKRGNLFCCLFMCTKPQPYGYRES